MTPVVILFLLFATLVLLVVTVAVLQEDGAHRRRLLAAVDADRDRGSQLTDRLDDALRRTRWGQRLTALLAGSGLGSRSPSLVIALVGSSTVLAAVLTYAVAGRIAAIVAGVVVVVSFRQWLERRREARIEKFISQLPELARLLANGAQAGLGVRRSIELAAREMDEPASGELQQVASELAIGQSLRVALEHLAERLPSRELVVLVQTLVIQGKAGGALVTALQNIAATLDERRQLRREITTAVVGATFSGYAVVLIGAFSVVFMNLLSPGALDTMFGTLPGQIALVAAASLFLIGFVVIRRITKVRF
ncbi:MAG: type II secretion system F family protein [Cellulomonas iranensis]|uniref:type II secretion system F family protein n=1 Tax=Cellulomonas iranensis TaxID=76862 RepID=UPI000B3D293E|nr:type II secretion system F family protein [Cellulomonas iranensis]MBO9567782.1 type II secretion system F family protein [Cellulomonas iranensis]UCN15721.1 type II secretion system F family protein [Cellulomonas iranensis]